MWAVSFDPRLGFLSETGLAQGRGTLPKSGERLVMWGEELTRRPSAH